MIGIRQRYENIYFEIFFVYVIRYHRNLFEYNWGYYIGVIVPMCHTYTHTYWKVIIEKDYKIIVMISRKHDVDFL